MQSVIAGNCRIIRSVGLLRSSHCRKCEAKAIHTQSANVGTQKQHLCMSSRSAFVSSPIKIRPIGMRCVERRGQLLVSAAFFGVGAPEAVLVGVVALVLFGPKGLAQAAKSLGATLRAFAPTIRELTDVSNELKSTLEEEIGINEIRQEFSGSKLTRNTVEASYTDFPTARQESKLEATSSELIQESPKNYNKDDSIDSDLEKMRQESARMAWGVQSEVATKDTTPDVQSEIQLSDLSVEELEAELRRRQSGQL